MRLSALKLHQGDQRRDEGLHPWVWRQASARRLLTQKSPAMSAFYLALLLLAVNVASLAAARSPRGKRSLSDLQGMIKCTTGKNYITYSSYGCYCGGVGKGKPIDQTDRCCFQHGCCYARAERYGCKSDTDYDWTCNRDGTARCGITDDKCKRLICNCDREFANCLKHTPYNWTKPWPISQCSGSKPFCAYKGK
ncbi:phospholipase A2-like isoform X2 [Entelurus aequoreus]|uniref:phospholipase A2-like isoform X2 n=1 Tax=Entelurus aequoreus TaxID=161455 RepID=UPI002B1E54CA|nr:phospholipase A2-like isoform X2 [Entelurus aequoreus]